MCELLIVCHIDSIKQLIDCYIVSSGVILADMFYFGEYEGIL